jgi:glucosamine 6-phosphate synthetase-like amidotransferase/phosphosugar isomerase protein
MHSDLVTGLKKLENRGYDSAGVAVLQTERLKSAATRKIADWKR